MGSGHSNGDASSNASNKTMVCYEEVPSLDVDPETESFIFEEGYTILKKIGEGSYGKVKSLSFLLACVSQLRSSQHHDSMHMPDCTEKQTNHISFSNHF